MVSVYQDAVSIPYTMIVYVALPLFGWVLFVV